MRKIGSSIQKSRVPKETRQKNSTTKWKNRFLWEAAFRKDHFIIPIFCLKGRISPL
ncbi:hypothetical protein Acin_1266 [Acidaminococcus intestini RyC-MR95]|uniref:Uncharacterized protein n=1 Tax=Acidaminococcus intestini (strain RyC-MR95) TaxID=568816 RepID=G4Q8Q8_ACIIR|nr:hypothetical protein Acin_1266 [Acidaminococcus intestini RyC-MR95]